MQNISIDLLPGAASRPRKETRKEGRKEGAGIGDANGEIKGGESECREDQDEGREGGRGTSPIAIALGRKLIAAIWTAGVGEREGRSKRGGRANGMGDARKRRETAGEDGDAPHIVF